MPLIKRGLLERGEHLKESHIIRPKNNIKNSLGKMQSLTEKS